MSDNRPIEEKFPELYCTCKHPKYAEGPFKGGFSVTRTDDNRTEVFMAKDGVCTTYPLENSAVIFLIHLLLSTLPDKTRFDKDVLIRFNVPTEDVSDG